MLSRKLSYLLIFGFLLIGYNSNLALAAPPDSPYMPGETISPSCAPGTENCTVRPFAVSGLNDDITSLTGLTTPLPVSEGGVGIASYNLGDTLYANGTSTLGVLGIGTTGQVLSVIGGLPSWANLSSLGLTTTNVSEGSNLYFTNARVQSYLDSLSKDYFFSTTSASDFLSLNQGEAFSSSSAAYWLSQQNMNNLAGGTDVNWNYFNGLLHPATSTSQVLIGGVSTSTLAKLQVIGGAMFDAATSTGFDVSNLTVGSLSGIVKAVGGIISAGTVNLASDISGILSVANGGTGTSTAPAYGALLAGNGSGGYAQVATSSLGLLTSNVAEGSNLYYTAARVQSFLDAVSKGYFFSTTSAQYLLSQNQNASFLDASSTNADITNLIATNVDTANLTVGSFTGLLKAASGVVSSAVAGIDYQAPISGTYPIQYSNNTLSLGFGTSTSNAWSGVQQFSSVAASVLNDYAGAYFGSTATSSFSADGSLTLAKSLNVSSGGTGLGAVQTGALLYGNGTAALATTSPATQGQILAYLNNTPTWVATTTYSGALNYLNGTVSVANGSVGNTLLTNPFVGLSAGAGLAGGGSVTLGSSTTLSLDTSHGNIWNALQQFANGASTTVLSVSGNTTLGSLTLSSLSGILHATAGVISASLINLASDVTGTLPVTNGGTGSTTLTGLLKGNGTGALQTAIPGVDYLASAITGIGPAGQQQTGPSIIFATSTDATIGLAINASGNTVTFTPQWFGALSAGRGGTGITSYTPGDLIYANSPTSFGHVASSTGGTILETSFTTGAPVWVATSTLGLSFSNIGGSVSNAELPANISIAAGSINGTSIGASVPSTGVFTNSTTSGLTVTGSTSLASLTVSGTASSSNVVISNGLTLGSVSGLLRATNGLVSTSFVNLATDITGTIGISHGGTGWTSIQAGALLYGNGSGALATTSAGVAGQTLAWLNGVPTWVATTTFSGALSYVNGAVSIPNGAISNTLLANSSFTLVAGSGLTGGSVLNLGGSGSLSLDTTNANIWTALQQFQSGASSTALSVYGSASFGGTATSSFSSNGGLTLGGIGSSLVLSLGAGGKVVGTSTPTFASVIATSTTATSTFAGGLSVGTNAFTILQNGNVGIGTASPGSALSVVGKISATAGFNGTCFNGSLVGLLTLTCNQDIAESYPTYEATEPGNVVAIPPSAEQQSSSAFPIVEIGKSRGVAGERVLGVVSSDPSIVFNYGSTEVAGANTGLVSATTTVVALSGRVLVKVSAENGPIVAGDELAASADIPGVAVRAEGVGNVLGEALESYGGAAAGNTQDEDGSGEADEILVFVNPHWSFGNILPASSAKESSSTSIIDNESTLSIRQVLDQVGIFMQDGVATFHELFAKKIHTDDLCVGDTCVTADEFSAMVTEWRASHGTPLPVSGDDSDSSAAPASAPAESDTDSASDTSATSSEPDSSSSDSDTGSASPSNTPASPAPVSVAPSVPVEVAPLPAPADSSSDPDSSSAAPLETDASSS